MPCVCLPERRHEVRSSRPRNHWTDECGQAALHGGGSPFPTSFGDGAISRSGPYENFYMSQDPCDTDIDLEQMCVESAELECRVDGTLGPMVGSKVGEEYGGRDLCQVAVSVGGALCRVRRDARGSPVRVLRVGRYQVSCLGQLGRSRESHKRQQMCRDLRLYLREFALPSAFRRHARSVHLCSASSWPYLDGGLYHCHARCHSGPAQWAIPSPAG